MQIQITSWRNATILTVEAGDHATVGDVADKARDLFRIKNWATLQAEDEVMIERGLPASELDPSRTYELAEMAGGV